MPDPTRVAHVERILFAIVLLSVAWFFEAEGGVNANANLDQCHSIVADGDLAIDEFVFFDRTRPPAKVGATHDWARAPDGRYYSNKAPGLSFLCVPVYAVLHAIERAGGVDPLAWRVYAFNRVVLTVLVVGVLAAAGIVALLRTGLALGFSLATATAAAAAVSIGTAYLPYASVLYTHTPAAALVALALLCSVRGARAARFERWAFAAGLAAGWAFLVDYSCVFAVLGIAGYWAAALRSPRALAVLALGGLLPLALFLGHNHAVYGHPLRTSYAFLNPDLLDPSGSNFERPPLSRLLRMALGPWRGLLVFSPALALAGFGAVRALRRHPAEAGACLAVFAASYAFNACVVAWHGGSTTGPRYLITAMPVLLPLVAHGAEAAPRFLAFSLPLSILTQLGILAAGVMCDENVASPLAFYVVPSIMGFLEGGRPNVAKLAGLAGPASLAPIAIAWAAAWWLVERAARRADQPA